MKKTVYACFILMFLVEIAALVFYAAKTPLSAQDAVAVNEIVQSVTRDFSDLDLHENQTALKYAVIDESGVVLFQTDNGISTDISSAILHRDTILDIESDGVTVGKVIIFNPESELRTAQKRNIITVLAAALIVQCGICIGIFAYLQIVVLKPFKNLKRFAERVACGNLDIPLKMDKRNVFGAFTESFDVMRSELKAARKAEAEAQQSKKELVAKLSHDIKTPVASIAALSEVGAAVSKNKEEKCRFDRILAKANQIDTLITNLFTATLEELQQLSVVPAGLEASEIKTMLQNADYLNRADIPEAPQCLVCADKLRLQQVFDNIFANSYKYANTEIVVNITRADNGVVVEIEDFGGGVPPEELPVIKEKFKRGCNSAGTEGAGLGLFISAYFMREMHGGLEIENGENGLKVSVTVAFFESN